MPFGDLIDDPVDLLGQAMMATRAAPWPDDMARPAIGSAPTRATMRVTGSICDLAPDTFFHLVMT